MARPRRTTLPPVTSQDIEQRPEMLRKTPHGGWAWKCQHCGRYASSRLRSGRLVCHEHGGTRQARALQRFIDELEAERTKAGFYGQGDGEDRATTVERLVAEYKAQGLDPDDTEEDLLYLRAYLAELKTLLPLVEKLEAQLAPILEGYDALLALVPADGDGHSIAQLMQVLPALREIGTTFRAAARLQQRLERFGASLERRHVRLIRLVKLRKETELKQRAVADPIYFKAQLVRLKLILERELPPPAYLALQKRFEKDLLALGELRRDLGVSITGPLD